MPQMLERYPVVGWVRPQNTQVLQDEIDSLRAKVKQLETELGNRQADPLTSVPKVSMHEVYSFEYRMHAYQDGTLKKLNHSVK